MRDLTGKVSWGSWSSIGCPGDLAGDVHVAGAGSDCDVVVGGGLHHAGGREELNGHWVAFRWTNLLVWAEAHLPEIDGQGCGGSPTTSTSLESSTVGNEESSVSA